MAPTIAISGAANVNEGSAYSLTLGAVTDPGSDTVTSYVVHWGDGNTDTYATNGVKTHTYADGPASRAITVDLVDEDGTFLNRANALSVTVDNVAPTATFNAPTAVNEGSVINLSLTSPSDPSSVDTTAGFTYAFDCGSGYGAFSGTSTASCPTSDNGSRTVKGKIRDKDGGVDRVHRHRDDQQRGAHHRHRGAANVNEGAAYSLTWRGHRSGQRHRGQLRRALG